MTVHQDTKMMTTSLNWITDRSPTEADGDAYGDVVVLLESGKGEAWCMMYWKYVDSGQPWIPSAPPAVTPTAPTVQPRSVKSLVEAESTVMAVADDGTAWYLSADWSKWNQLPALPMEDV